MTIAANITAVVRKQELHASVIRACANCGAPGYWHNIPGVNVGCYAPEKVTKLGEDFVGLVCPQCGAARSPIEKKGKIWEMIWRVGLWAALRDAIRDMVSKVWQRRTI